MEDRNEPRTARLNAASMTDPIAEWPLSRVVALLRKKEKEKDGPIPESRVFCRSSIRFLDTVLDEVASELGALRGSTTRWLSYHGLEIFRNSGVIKDLQKSYSLLRRRAIETNDPDMAAIINAMVPYSPADSNEDRAAYRLYPHVHAGLEELAQICGAPVGRMVQMAMVRSILTADLPVLEPVAARLGTESERWNRWMRFRAGQMEIAVSIWENSRV